MATVSMKKERMKGTGIRKGRAAITFNILGYSFVGLTALICLLPFIFMISGSFSSEKEILLHGYSLLPREFTLEAYSTVFRFPEKIIRAYGVSVFITAVGTGIGLFILTMAAYVMSRQDFKYRNVLSFFFYFTTLFNGGMVSTYIFYIQYLHLKDSILSLILPGMLSVFNMLIMRSFITAVPSALIESAKIDGAPEFTIFIKIIMPLLKSGLATIGLFMALHYWNDWYNAMLYLNSEEKYPLQYMLYDLLNQAQSLARIAAQSGVPMDNLPTNTLKLAMAVVATGPIVLLYPFVQKYFVKGIAVGSVKG